MVDPIRALPSLPLGGEVGFSETPAKSPAQEKGSGDEVSDSFELSPEAQRKVAELRQGDQQVRSHEAAHQGAAGGLARGGATYTYKRGPDGQLYAVAGEVSLDTSPVQGNPQATLAKAQRIIAAALAPADPSPQDRAVAASAAAMAAKASAELASSKGKGAEAPRTLNVLA
jgi:hypothetical protein